MPYKKVTLSMKHAAAEVDHASARSSHILPSEDGHEPQAQHALAPMRRDERLPDADARGPESRRQEHELVGELKARARVHG